MRTSPRRRPAAPLLALLALLAFAACDDEPAGPERGYTIRVRAGDNQFAGFGQLLENPLEVTVEDASTGVAVQGVTVTWAVVDGAGASLGAEASTTDANGVAATTLRLGPADGDYRVHATTADLVGPAASFEASAVAPAHIDSVAPADARVGDTIRVNGTGFALEADDNTVLVDGFRAAVVEASATQLRVVVPACVPTRTAAVVVNLGIVESNQVALSVTGSAERPLDMAVGEVRFLEGAAATACVRLAASARYLVLLQNATEIAGVELPWRLTGAAADALIAAPDRPRGVRWLEQDDRRALRAIESAAAADAQRALDTRLRALEAEAAVRAGGMRRPGATSPDRAPTIELGDEREFWVFRRAGEYAHVTAVVVHVSEHAILYEDVDAPAAGFEPGDFQAFGAIFDDPIYETLVGVYGQPSDVDGNGRVIILFTPVVNQMTPPGSPSGFVAGFFFGVDLLEDQAHGNRAEVFYTLVPDPDGEFGNVRTFEQMLQGVPPVMAHEFQHMIHFNQRVLVRDASLEHIWLSEALAHTAEELVGDEYLARGEDERAFDFRVQNFLRADAWMDDPAIVSLIGPSVPLPVRGAGWLLLEYLQGHFGANALLTSLTTATESGAENLRLRTGLGWGEMLSRWGIAVWADDAGIAGLDPVYTFPTVDLRAVYADTGFPLQPLPLPWADFGRTGALPSAASMYWLLDAGLATSTLNVSVAGRHAPFGATDRPQLTILRIE